MSIKTFLFFYHFTGKVSTGEATGWPLSCVPNAWRSIEMLTGAVEATGLLSTRYTQEVDPSIERDGPADWPEAIVATKGIGTVVCDVGSTVPSGQTTCATVENDVVVTFDEHRLVTERTSENSTCCPGGLVEGASSPN